MLAYSWFLYTTINETLQLILCISFTSVTHFAPRYLRSVWTEASLLPIIGAPVFPVQDLLPLLMKFTISSDVYFHNICKNTYKSILSWNAITVKFHPIQVWSPLQNKCSKQRMEKANNQSSQWGAVSVSCRRNKHVVGLRATSEENRRKVAH